MKELMSILRRSPIKLGRCWLGRVVQLMPLALGVSSVSTDVLGQSNTEAEHQSLEEVVVTARRREENAQDVPISITAFNAQKIRSIGAQKLEELPIPNFYLGEPSGGASFPQVSIRGIFSVQFAGGFDPGFGVYIDGIYVGRPQAVVNMDVKDIETLEILRGPQGTLFGRNTISGALNVVTKAPGDELSGHTEIQLGNYNLRRVRGSINVPIIEDTLSARLSVHKTDRDGYVDYLGNDICMDCGANIDMDGGRLQLLYTPSDKLSLRLIGDYLNSGGISYAFENSNELSGGNPTPFTVQGDLGKDWRDNKGVALIAEYEFARGYTLTSITGWRDDLNGEVLDVDYSTQDNFFIDNLGIASEQLTQEIRLASPSDNWYEYVAGIYWFDQTVKDGADIPVAFGFDYLSKGKTETQSYAIFGQTDLHITDTTTLFVGGRYTYDEREATFSQEGSAIGPFGLLTGYDAKLDSQEPSWNVGVRHQYSENVMVYGSVSRGFKAGGFETNLFVGADRVDNVTVDPEFITSYEIGFKSTLLNDRLRLNTALFYMDQEDVQVLSRSVNPDIPDIEETRLQNAARVIAKGVELDAIVLLTENLTFSSGVGYTQSEFDRYPGVTSIDGVIIDADGNDVPFSPDWTVDIALDYKRSLKSGDTVMLRLNSQYISERFDSEDLGRNQPARLMPGYNVANANIGYEPASERWSANLWVKNLTDKRGYVKKAIFGAGIHGRHFIEPRTYGLTLTANF